MNIDGLQKENDLKVKQAKENHSYSCFSNDSLQNALKSFCSKDISVPADLFSIRWDFPQKDRMSNEVILSCLCLRYLEAHNLRNELRLSLVSHNIDKKNIFQYALRGWWDSTAVYQLF